MASAGDRRARNIRDLLSIQCAVKEVGASVRSITKPIVETTSQCAEIIIAALGIAARWERRAHRCRKGPDQGQEP